MIWWLETIPFNKLVILLLNGKQKNSAMKNKTLTKNMPNVKWKAIPPVRGPNPQGVIYGRNAKTNYKQMGTSKKVPSKNVE